MPLRHDLRRGIICMLAACALFAAMGALVKLLSPRIPFTELMFFRTFFAMPVVMLIVWRRTAGRSLAQALRTKRLGGHVLRALTGVMAMSASFYTLTVLPLAEQTALTNATPLFVTLLSIPVLGEKVGIHRASAVLVGFLGILVIALGQGAFQQELVGAAKLGLIAAVAHGVFAAGTTLMVRTLSATEASTTIVLWQSLLMSTMIALALPFNWVTPTPQEFLLLLATGLLGGVAQVLLTEAWASAQVSALAPYSYSSIVWAALAGWLLFGDLPTLWTIIGALLIVAASLYIVHRELVRQRRKH